MVRKTKKLNMGCCRDIRKGYVNLDELNFPGVDVVHDLNKTPYPFPDNHFDEIYCSMVLYIMDDWQVALKEMHRISKHNAKWMISVPYYNSRVAYNTFAKHRFTMNSFDYFAKGKVKNDIYKKFYPTYFEITNIHLEPGPLGKIIPHRLRNAFGMIFGEVVHWIRFEMKVIKKEKNR